MVSPSSVFVAPQKALATESIQIQAAPRIVTEGSYQFLPHVP